MIMVLEDILITIQYLVPKSTSTAITLPTDTLEILVQSRGPVVQGYVSVLSNVWSIPLKDSISIHDTNLAGQVLTLTAGAGDFGAVCIFDLLIMRGMGC
jgi:hypothetical protein